MTSETASPFGDLNVPTAPEFTPVKSRGRKRILTEAKAFEILEARRFAFFDITSSAQFAKRLVEEGITPRELHPHTICKLFAGKLLPTLRNPHTGELYDYKSVLRFPFGRPAGSKTVPGGKLSKGRALLKKALIDESAAYLRNIIGVKAAELRFEARRDLDDLKQEVQTLRTQVERLELALGTRIQIRKVDHAQ